jgi:FkbM family methyltransferase
MKVITNSLVICACLLVILSVAVTAVDNAELEAQYSKWLESYKAPQPKFQHYCKNSLSGKRERGAAQFGQDLFMFFNLFKYWPMQNRKGFYVDSGANHAQQLSNSFFYDVCLGWEGLCVEPMEMYHQSLRNMRSCVLVPECISDKVETTQFLHATTGSRIRNQGEVTSSRITEVKCLPLGDMLKLSSNASRNEIDLWSLDVEGHELTVLEGTNFKTVHVSSMLIENSHINQCKLDAIMWRKGFHKYEQLIIDGVYLRNGTAALNPVGEKKWFHEGFQKDFVKERKLDVIRSQTHPEIFPPENQKPCVY